MGTPTLMTPDVQGPAPTLRAGCCVSLASLGYDGVHTLRALLASNVEEGPQGERLRPKSGRLSVACRQFPWRAGDFDESNG